MSKCPFWSTKKEKVNCYSDCPMQNSISNEEIGCSFKECSDLNTKVSLVDNLSDDLFYSQDRYLSYDDKVINY